MFFIFSDGDIEFGYNKQRLYKGLVSDFLEFCPTWWDIKDIESLFANNNNILEV